MPPRKRRRLNPSNSKTESGPEGKLDYLEKCLPMILPYVPLKDLVILQQSCSFFAPFVDKIIASGKHIRIDKDFIERFPVAVNKQLYNQIGARKTSVTVSGLAKEEFPPLSFFKSVTHVNVEQMEISGEDVSYFPDVPSIKLSKCKIRTDSLAELLKPDRSLLSFHLAHVDMDYEGCDRTWSDFLDRLQHITVEGFNGNIDLKKAQNLQSVIARGTGSRIYLPFYDLFLGDSDLRRLDLEYATCHWPYPFGSGLAPLFKLEFFSIRGLYPEAVWNMMKFKSSLKIFECHNAPIRIDKILQLGPGLEYANIFCNWYHEEELRNHFSSLKTMKSFSVTSCAPTPGYNLVSSLNDDYMREIISYLNDHDVMKLLAVHPALSNILSCLTISPDSIKLWPSVSVTGFYEQLGANTSQLRVEGITEEEFYNIIPKFKQLQKLELVEMHLKDLEKVSLAPYIPHLYIRNNKDHKFPCELFRHWNPKLVRFETYNEDPRSMKVLTHLQDLNFLLKKTPRRNLKGIKTFLGKNPQLTRATIYMVHPCYTLDDVASLLESINATSIRYLYLGLVRDKCVSIGDAIGGAISRLCNLEELQIKHCKITVDEVKYLAPCKLTALTVYGTIEDNEISEIVKRILTLKTLTLFTRREPPSELVDGVLRPYLNTQGRVVEIRSIKAYCEILRGEISGYTMTFTCTN